MIVSSNKKKQEVYCCAYYCYNEPVKKKGGLCHKHYWRLQKEKDPIAVRYNNFKSNAVKRGIPVIITLPEFREFCQRTGYMIVKGRCGKNATIERPDPNKGYTTDKTV